VPRFAVAVGTLLIVVLLGVPAGAHGCAVTVDPDPGWPGANLHVTGRGFTAGADITVYLGDFPVYDGFIDALGGFDITPRIPIPFEAGAITLAVIDHTGACDASVDYEIGAEPPAESAIPIWGLGVVVIAGALLGTGLAGVVLRKR